MKKPFVLAALALTLLIAGCGPTGGTAAPTTDPAPVESATPSTPVAAAVVMSLDGLDVVDADGTSIESATFTDPDAMLALLSELLGSTPTPTDYTEFGNRTYEWGGILFGTSIEPGDFSWVRSEEASFGDLPLQTTDGIQIGSTRDEVEALGPFDLDYDSDGDGASDLLGLEQQEVPGTDSLSFPGQPGTAFVEVQLEGDTVTVLRSPSNDYSDV